MVHKGDSGVKNVQKIVYMVYEWPHTIFGNQSKGSILRNFAKMGHIRTHVPIIADMSQSAFMMMGRLMNHSTRQHPMGEVATILDTFLLFSIVSSNKQQQQKFYVMVQKIEKMSNL